MIRSMTGYGRSMMHLGEADITVEIRAVNNRFLDVSVKLPKALSYCEDKIKAERKAAADNYRYYLEQMQGDYALILADSTQRQKKRPRQRLRK